MTSALLRAWLFAGAGACLFPGCARLADRGAVGTPDAQGTIVLDPLTASAPSLLPPERLPLEIAGASEPPLRIAPRDPGPAIRPEAMTRAVAPRPAAGRGPASAPKRTTAKPAAAPRGAKAKAAPTPKGKPARGAANAQAGQAAAKRVAATPKRR